MQKMQLLSQRANAKVWLTLDFLNYQTPVSCDEPTSTPGQSELQGRGPVTSGVQRREGPWSLELGLSEEDAVLGYRRAEERACSGERRGMGVDVVTVPESSRE